MLKAIDIANFFIDLANNDPDDCMTNLRLNKLLYFAQSWCLVKLNRPLFEEDVQAWKYGPVIPSVYKKLKKYGRERIKNTVGNYSADIFSSDELEILIEVANIYCKFSSPALVDLTHKIGSPWQQIYCKNKSNQIISKESLKNYFSKNLQINNYKSLDLNSLEKIGYRDPIDNILVLPSEYNDA